MRVSCYKRLSSLVGIKEIKIITYYLNNNKVLPYYTNLCMVTKTKIKLNNLLRKGIYISVDFNAVFSKLIMAI
jgi:hypothetical protein